MTTVIFSRWLSNSCDVNNFLDSNEAVTLSIFSQLDDNLHQQLLYLCLGANEDLDFKRDKLAKSNELMKQPFEFGQLFTSLLKQAGLDSGFVMESLLFLF